MAIPQGYATNYATLLSAAGDGRLVLAECRRIDNGGAEFVLCAVNGSEQEGEGIELVPIAKLFHGNPYAEVVPVAEWERQRQAAYEAAKQTVDVQGGAQ